MDNPTTIVLLVIVAIAIIVSRFTKFSSKNGTSHQPRYMYARREKIMTEAEIVFYRRLQTITKGRYIIFPQIHLSSLAINKTTGKYYKLGFQRINRRSVDYVLADPQTFRAIYAVELDDRTHDTARSQYRDKLVTDILNEINLPLVRFRNPINMSDEDIISKFQEANSALDA